MARLCLAFTAVVFTIREVGEFELVNARGRVERERGFKASVAQSAIICKSSCSPFKKPSGFSIADFEMNIYGEKIE